MFLDVHAHAYRIPPIPPEGSLPFPTADDLLKYYDRIGVDRAVLLPLIGPENYFPESNMDILEMAQQHPDRFIPFCNVHPQAIWNDPHTPLEKMIARYVEAGCKGVGEVTFNFSFFDPYMRNLFRAVNSLRLPMTIHFASRVGGGYGIVDEPGLPGLDETLGTYPDIAFLGHSGNFWAEISTLRLPEDRGVYPVGKVTEGTVPKLMRKHPNLYGDLSAGSGRNALMRDEEYAVKFLHEFQDRLLFGLDICAVPISSDFEKLPAFLTRLRDEGKISSEIFEKVSHRNAEKLLNL